MLRLLIITSESKDLKGLGESLEQNEFVSSVISYKDGLEESVNRQLPDLLLVEMDGNLPDSVTSGLIRKLQQKRQLPVIALVHGEMLDNIDERVNVDDFITSPYDARELALRIKRLP